MKTTRLLSELNVAWPQPIYRPLKIEWGGGAREGERRISVDIAELKTPKGEEHLKPS